MKLLPRINLIDVYPEDKASCKKLMGSIKQALISSYIYRIHYQFRVAKDPDDIEDWEQEEYGALFIEVPGNYKNNKNAKVIQKKLEDAGFEIYQTTIGKERELRSFLPMDYDIISIKFDKGS